VKRTPRKLALRADTVRVLTVAELRAAQGGVTTLTPFMTQADSCTADLRTT
jgi:hypothetical protein